MNRERLTAYLKPEHRQEGLYLEDDEDFVYLKRGDKTLAVWSAMGATREAILEWVDIIMSFELSEKRPQGG